MGVRDVLHAGFARLWATSAGGAALRSWHAIPENVRVFFVVAGIVGYAGAQVAAKQKPAGHDLASNEKPQALRKEGPRSVEEERARLVAAGKL